MFRESETGSGYWLLRQMILSARKGEDKNRLTAFPKPIFDKLCRGQGAKDTRKNSRAPGFTGTVIVVELPEIGFVCTGTHD